MSDRLFYALAALAAILMIGLALATPHRPGRGEFNLPAAGALR